MYNNLTFLSIPLNKAQLLIHLTLWTFSVGSYEEGVGVDGGCRAALQKNTLLWHAFCRNIAKK
jgi:hypothetical protein